MPSKLFDECLALAPDVDRRAPDVSEWSVAQHLEHVVSAAEGITRQLEAATPGALPPKFNWTRLVVFLSGRIPRGRARAPESVLPAERPELEALRARLAAANALEDRLREMPADLRWEHHVFGPLDPAQSLRFIQIHNRHHCRIAREILRASS